MTSIGRFLFTSFAVLCLFLSQTTVAEVSNSTQAKKGGIISIDGALTEIVYELGAQERLLAVDTTSRYPQAATELPQVGYMRQLSAEGILSLHPELVIASKEAGPEMVFEQLTAAGIKVVRIDAPSSLEGVLLKVKRVAEVLGLENNGAILAEKIQSETEAILSDIAGEKSPSTLFLLGASNRGLMAAGKGTKAQAIMDMLNVQNAFSHQGYKPVSAEGAVMAAPEIVLVGHTGSVDIETDIDTVKQTLAMTPANNNDQVHTVDIGLALGFGPRIADALAALKSLVYPEQDMSQVAVE
jgi:iron complex transport system substrate-binding protein